MSEVLVAISFLAVIDIFFKKSALLSTSFPVSSLFFSRNKTLSCSWTHDSNNNLHLQVRSSCMMWKSLGYRLVVMTNTSHDIIILDSSQILGATQLGSFLEVERERTGERGCTLNFYFYKVQKFKKVINSDLYGEAMSTGSTFSRKPISFSCIGMLQFLEFLHFSGYLEGRASLFV